MKFYCKCGNELTTPGKKSCLSLCPCGEEWIPLADFETPAQYEKRTDKKLSNDAAVWFLANSPHAYFKWGICRYESAKRDKDIMIVVQSPEPPPEDWEPIED